VIGTGAADERIGHDARMSDHESSALYDLHAIRALVERYAQAVDTGDGAAFARVFTPDGHLGYQDGSAVTHFHGREELAAIPVVPTDDTPRTMHFIGNHIADVDGDTATAVTYCQAHHLHADRSNLVMMIRYHDRLTRGTDGTWLIADRHVTLEWTETRQADPASS
jgi:uncharacterized protein (TIGR02246 family)